MQHMMLEALPQNISTSHQHCMSTIPITCSMPVHAVVSYQLWNSASYVATVVLFELASINGTKTTGREN